MRGGEQQRRSHSLAPTQYAVAHRLVKTRGHHTGSLGDVNCGSAHPHAQLSELGPQHPHPTVLQLQRVFQLFEARLQDRALPALSHRASGLL
jgi:hypothetical protein